LNPLPRKPDALARTKDQGTTCFDEFPKLVHALATVYGTSYTLEDGAIRPSERAFY